MSAPLLPKVKAELNQMENKGVIHRVMEATPWCTPMVPVLKKSDDIQICVDLKQLNKIVCCEKFQMPTMDEILPKLAGATAFSKLDASSGFWSVPLHPDSYNYTTFITPFGRYVFDRLPFGITSTPEICQ